jgi:hypothetical protein
VDRRLLARIEGEICIVDIPLNAPRPLKRAVYPLGDLLHQPLEGLRTRRRHSHEPQSTLTVPPIIAVEYEQMETDIEIERTAEALYQHDLPGHRACARPAGI